MMLSRWYAGSLALAILTCLAGHVPAADPRKPPDLATVLQAWEAHGTVHKSWDFAWSGRHFQSRAQLAMSPGLRGKGPEAARQIQADVESPYTMRSVSDGTRNCRFEYEDQRWSSKKKALVPTTLLDVFDGKVGKRYCPQDEIKGGYVLTADFSKNNCKFAYVTPLLLFFRPFSPVLGQWRRAEVTMVSADVLIQGRKCCLLKQQDKDQADLVWLDVARAYVPIRYSYHYLERSVDKPAGTIEMQYARDAEHGWLPSSWTNTFFDAGGDVLQRFTAQVTRYQLDLPTPHALFDIEFGPDTWVQNYVTNESYILKADGTRRPVSPGEFTGDNFPEMLQRSSAPGPPWLAMVGTGVVVVACVLVVLWYRRKRVART